jgi:RNA polymerase sigma factor (sigma-70 family)
MSGLEDSNLRAIGLSAANKILRCPHAAEDALQNTYLHILARGHFEHRAVFASYFYTTVVRPCLVRLRYERAKRRNCNVTDNLDKAINVSHGMTPEEILLQKEQINRILSAVRDLPPGQRSTMLQHILNGDRKITDLAASSGITKEAFKCRLHHGRRKISEVMGAA